MSALGSSCLQEKDGLEPRKKSILCSSSIMCDLTGLEGRINPMDEEDILLFRGFVPIWYIVVDKASHHRAVPEGYRLQEGDRVIGHPNTYSRCCEEASRLNLISEIMST
jgi:hypothetical protein